MDQVRKSASAKTAAEKLVAMRGKMEECGVDGELSSTHHPNPNPHVPFFILCSMNYNDKTRDPHMHIYESNWYPRMIHIYPNMCPRPT